MNAQNNLGLLYSLGQGVEQDGARAVAWFTKAAEQGDVKAQCPGGKCRAQERCELSPTARGNYLEERFSWS